MKKLFIVALAALCLCGCAEPEHKIYTTSGHYYANGEVITEDGNIWGFQQSDIYKDGQPVEVIMNDAGTPDYIYDDEIMALIG